jgi:hypothetical protein
MADGLGFQLGAGLEQLLITGLGLSEELPEGERDEEDALAFVELGLEFDPVQTCKKILIKNIYLWPMPLFLLSTHKQCISSHFIHNSTAMFS